MFGRITSVAMGCIASLLLVVNAHELGHSVAMGSNCSVDDCAEHDVWYFNMNPMVGQVYGNYQAQLGRTTWGMGGNPAPANTTYAPQITCDYYGGWVPGVDYCRCGTWTPNWGPPYELWFADWQGQSQGTYQTTTYDNRRYCADDKGYGVDKSWNDYLNANGKSK
jgi:hypothetical protein